MNSLPGSPLILVGFVCAISLLIVLSSVAAGVELPSAHPETAESNAWVRLSIFGPSPRFGYSMAYSPNVGGIVLFGGGFAENSTNLTAYGDTWKFINDSWSQVHPSSSPPARINASMVYDEADGYILLFGGSSGSASGKTSFNDTWKFDDGRWTNISPAHSPATRAGAAMVYDMRDGYVVLFGGEYSCGLSTCPLGDTWKFVNDTWSQVGHCGGPGQSACGNGTPAPAWGAEFTSNKRSPLGRHSPGSILLTGGYTPIGHSPGYVPTDDWKFKGGHWINVTASSYRKGGHDPGVADAGAAPDSFGLNHAIVFGGITSGGNFVNTTWESVSGGWVTVNTRAPHAPSPRAGFSMAWYQGLRSDVLFGGTACWPANSSCAMNETWLLTTSGGTVHPPAADLHGANIAVRRRS